MDERAGKNAIRTVVGVVLANIATQVVVYAICESRHVNVVTALRISLAVGLMFYGFIAAWVGVRSQLLGVQARWLIGDRRRAAATGLAAGALGAVIVTALASSATHHVHVDAMAGMLANSGLLVFLLGAIVIAVIAPFVEEFIFRGFLLEALRPSGAGVAILVSSVAFSIAHLRFAQFQYYALMGVAFATIYCKRGLLASICAHAAFNGGLVVIAVLATYGPPTTFHADGLAFRLPATWHEVSSGGANGRFVVMGPGDAVLAVTHSAIPAGYDFNRLIARLEGDSSGEVDPSSVRTVDLPIGPAVMFTGTHAGHQHDLAIISSGTQLVGLDLLTQGNSRALHDLDQMVRTLQSS
jgi:membrane protease YdiL (CAAX protease family)